MFLCPSRFLPEEATILLIDDEPGFHELFRYLLEPLAVRIESAYDGVEGLGCSFRRDYAIIFLDIHMPKMLGTEVLKKIKESKPHQRVVLLSSVSGRVDLLEDAQGMGIEACLGKPFNADDVIALVDKILRGPRGQ